MKRIVLLLALAVLVAGAATANPRRTVDALFDVDGAEEIQIELKIGELVIEPSTTGRVEVEVDLRCRNDSPTCERQLERVEIEEERRSGRLRVYIAGVSKSSSRRMEVDATVRVPIDVDLAVDLGIGELDITGVESDIYVDMGIGEARLWLSEASVGSVYLDSGIGEASVYGTSDHSVDSSRSFLIGSEVEWEGGPGSSEVVVDLGIGEVAVHLD